MGKEAAAISKAVWNEGLRLTHSDILGETFETARATLMRRDAEDLPWRLRRESSMTLVISAFSPENLRSI